MIFVSGSSLQTLCGSMLGHEFLDAVRNPDVYHTYSTHCAEPSKGCLHVSRSIVSMEAKKTTYENAPSNGFHRVLESEKVFNLKSTVLDILVILSVFEEIVVRGLVLLDVLAPKLMDL